MNQLDQLCYQKERAKEDSIFYAKIAALSKKRYEDLLQAIKDYKALEN